MHRWSDARRRAWRWGWIALTAGVLCAPVVQVGSCSDGAGDAAGRCETVLAPIVLAPAGIGVPVP